MAARPSLPKYHYLRDWLTGGSFDPQRFSRPVVLECIRSRSGMSMQVYDRGELMFRVNGCGFDRIGSALGRFLEELFQPELSRLAVASTPEPSDVPREWTYAHGIYGFSFNKALRVSLDGACGISCMIEIAQAIGLKVYQSETKAGTLLIIERGA